MYSVNAHKKTGRRRAVAVFSLLCLFLLTGCFASKNEGAIDYRKAELHCSRDIDEFTKDSLCEKNDAAGENDVNVQGEALRIVKLKRKNVLHPKEKNAKFQDGDRIVIRLVSAYIEDYEEDIFSWINDIGEGQLLQRGEIAVAVKVHTVPDSGEGQKLSFDFSDNGVNDAKVVFYSDDVVEKQFLNFNNMPIYGPDSTKLDAVGIEVWIMELDVSGKLIGDVLGAISSLSAKPLPKDSPGDVILNSLGATIKNSSNQNDTNFLYRLLLEDKKDAHLPHAALEVGHYVLIRENRIGIDFGLESVEREFTSNTDWSKLVLDENSGRVYKNVSWNDTPEYEEYRDRSYLVISIDKDNSGPDLSIDNETYAAFVESLEKQSANPFIAALVREYALRELLKAFDKYYEARKMEDAMVEGKESLADKQKAVAKVRKEKTNAEKTLADREKTLADAKRVVADVKKALADADENNLANATDILVDSGKNLDKEAEPLDEREVTRLIKALDKEIKALGALEVTEVEDALDDVKKALGRVKSASAGKPLADAKKALADAVTDAENALADATNEEEEALAKATADLADKEREYEVDSKAEETKKTLIIKLTNFWNRYISYSLSKNLRRLEENIEINDNDLIEPQLKDIANKLQIKMTEGMDTESCKNGLFAWFSEKTTADKIKNGLIDLIENNECTGEWKNDNGAGNQ